MVVGTKADVAHGSRLPLHTRRSDIAEEFGTEEIHLNSSDSSSIAAGSSAATKLTRPDMLASECGRQKYLVPQAITLDTTLVRLLLSTHLCHLWLSSQHQNAIPLAKLPTLLCRLFSIKPARFFDKVVERQFYPKERRGSVNTNLVGGGGERRRENNYFVHQPF